MSAYADGLRALADVVEDLGADLAHPVTITLPHLGETSFLDAVSRLAGQRLIVGRSLVCRQQVGPHTIEVFIAAGRVRDETVLLWSRADDDAYAWEAESRAIAEHEVDRW